MKIHDTHIVLLFIHQAKVDYTRMIQLLHQIIGHQNSTAESKLYMSVEIIKRNQVSLKVLRKKNDDQDFKVTDYNGSLLHELGHFNFSIDMITQKVEPNFVLGTIIIKIPISTL
jgi:hypothetical protein